MAKQRRSAQAAGLGHTRAQFNLGLRCLEGNDVPQDKVNAARLFQQAVDQGLADAQYILGVCYEKGEGVPQDMAQAVRLYQQAAALGHCAVQPRLALLRVRWRAAGQG
jgi:TPR repeat protein